MKVVGIMSGTSMDGTDLALCDVDHKDGRWSVNLVAAQTFPYDEKWRIRLSQLRYQNAEVFAKTDVFYGRYLGETVRNFLSSHRESADLIASHGHTIFHDPTRWLTCQIGDGATMNAVTRIPVVSGFRRADVALGGQGAPLVGLGDDLLYPEYDFCLNLGGFCNISAIHKGRRIAFDISPCNIVLNRLARESGQSYDKDGEVAAQGEVIYPLLKRLDEIPFYQQGYPKSLGREWINREFWHIVRDFDTEPVADRMKTLVVHIARQIANAIHTLNENHGQGTRMLITGGGAHNPVLIDHLRSETEAVTDIPDSGLVDFKEAMIFALLGALRVGNMTNTLNSATGASQAWVSGSLDGDFSKLI
ncbi:MAG: anhydro-N-acetylmuramic acid kinase [Bacteroidia bacterium]|nr:anhydro-N-acetylmuramic acid kinase [Bacteroidia bacterium]